MSRSAQSCQNLNPVCIVFLLHEVVKYNDGLPGVPDLPPPLPSIRFIHPLSGSIFNFTRDPTVSPGERGRPSVSSGELPMGKSGM